MTRWAPLCCGPWTLDAGPGDAFTEDVKEAWATVYGILADTMKDAAKEAAA
jgi:hemoglobin-like flavoprotein